MMADILYVQYTNPANYPPLEHSSRLLADAGWRVRFVGVQAEGDAASLVLPTHPGVGVTMLPRVAPGWRQKVHYARFVLACFGATLQDRPSWVYASDVLACPVGWLASLVPGVRVVYHEHDTPGPAGGANRVLVWCRRSLARRAAVCVLPQAERAARFVADLSPRRHLVVWNAPRVAEVVAPRPPLEPGRLALWYHGSIVPSQFPESVVRAVAACPPGVTLEFAGYETLGSGGYVGRLLRLAGELGAGDRIRYRGAIPARADLLAAAAACDVGVLAFERSFREPMAGASNKPFDYAASGLALVYPDTPEWEGLYGAAGCGVGCDPADPVALSVTFGRLLADPAGVRRMGDAGRRKMASEWNYEAQFRALSDTIRRARRADARRS